MILQSLSLNNFGLYGGENSFDLAPDNESGKPVILVRGHNGGGKTTFLEAVRLALYGKRALGPRVARSDYETYLQRRIHVLSTERTASVKLAFTRSENNTNILYSVKRAWAARGASVVETMTLERDGDRLDSVPAEDWDHYLEDMIPPGISQLFFFDGEKIQDIADGASTDGLRDAVRSLLGLDLIDQLRSDLSLYTARRAASDTGSDLAAIERDLKAAKEELVITEEEAAQDRADLSHADRGIEKADRAFTAEGGAVALDRSGLKQTLKEIEKQIQWLQADLKRLAESPLPLSLAPKLIETLKSHVQARRSSSESDGVRAFLAAFEASEVAQSSKRPSWTKAHFKALANFVEEEAVPADTIVLDASPTWFETRLAGLDSDHKAQAIKLAADLDDAQTRKAELKRQLKTFDEAAASQLLDALRDAEYARGQAETRLSAKEQSISALRFRIGQLEKERARTIDVAFDRSIALHKVDLGERARAALAAYEARILARRIDTLAEHFTTCFNGLIRKKRLLERVDINPASFEITLVGADNAEIPKSALSAGERQIFAISMLWALGKTSGRDLPMIIDTPLSRLDRAHRKSLIRDYVPNASAQVILLCTDSELTPDLDEIVSPFVARRYEIGVSGERRRTEVQERAPEVIYAH